MLSNVKSRGLALLATVALLGGTAWIASGTTGAYFSDTHTGAIGGDASHWADGPPRGWRSGRTRTSNSPGPVPRCAGPSTRWGAGSVTRVFWMTRRMSGCSPWPR